MLVACAHVLLEAAFIFFFFNDTATTEIYTLSLHDALPISERSRTFVPALICVPSTIANERVGDRKSTRLNSSHDQISYAVFCLKKKRLCSEILKRFSRFGISDFDSSY